MSAWSDKPWQFTPFVAVVADGVTETAALCNDSTPWHNSQVPSEKSADVESANSSLLGHVTLFQCVGVPISGLHTLRNG